MANPQNRISAELSDADKAKILKALDGLEALLPFLVKLPQTERMDLLRVGDKSHEFIRKAAEAVKAHPGALPRSFNIAEFQKDTALLDALYSIVMKLRELTGAVEDTFMLTGSEAYAGALVVYRSLRDNDLDGSMEGALDDMASRFSRKNGPKNKPPAG